MKFEETYRRLNEAQRAAVNQIDGPLLVIAGPGTGKTQLLGTRVANILKRTDVNPEDILCLTFTEAGASEMRARLQSIIGAASVKVNISTYHAFGSDIIYLYNNFAERVTRNLDAPIDTVRQHKIITGLRDQLKHNDILRTAKVSDLIAAIAEAKTARLSARDLKKVAEENIADATKISLAASPILEQVVPRMKFGAAVELYKQVRAVLAEMVSAETIVGKVERLANPLLDSLHEAIEQEEAKDKPSISPLSKWKSRFFEKDAENKYVLNNSVANKKLLSLSGLLELYDNYLAAEGWFDFADMIEEAIKYLREDDAFRHTVQEKYQYILLDEFQDTNDSQLELIRLVADYERPNIMAVGDDDQAIFAFQGARYSNLMDFKESFDAAVVVLTVNYRSGQPVIDLGGKVAGQIAERFATKYGIEKNLQSRASYEGKTEAKTSIKRLNFTSSPSEYAWVAGQIAELVAGGVAQKEVAVIAPKHKHLEAIVPYFAEFPELKLSYDKRENILESANMMPLLKLARMIVNLAKIQPTAPDILEILSFEFWGLKPLEVVQAVHSMKEQRISALSYLEKSENPKLMELAEFFGSLALKSLDTPLEIMLDYILGTTPVGDFRSPYLNYYTEQNNESTISFYENLTVLREHLVAYKKQDNLRLKDLVEFAADYAAADQKLINTSPYEESGGAVKLLSAHGAKGLEFEYVFLISLDNNAWGTSKGNNNTLVLPKNLEFVRHTGATEDEKLRLFFVAITRAKYNLYLTGSLKDFSGKTMTPLKYLQEVEGISPWLPAEAQEITRIDGERPTLEMLTHNWAGRYGVREANIRELAKQKVENYRLSASDLTLYLDIIYGGPEEFYLKRVLKSPQAYSATASYGNYVHAVLDKITNEKIDNATALAYYQELVTQADLTDEDRDEILEKGLDNLGAYLKERGDFLRQAGHFSEVAFFKDNLSVDGVPMTGKVDHIEVDDKAKSVTIVDFKTGKFHKEKWEMHPTLLKYKLQLMFYKELLGAAPKYRGYKVDTAMIDFVTPDDDGKIKRKVLEFSDQDMGEFRELCKAVYGNIRDLEFPDVSGYEKTLRGMREFIRSLAEQNPN